MGSAAFWMVGALLAQGAIAFALLIVLGSIRLPMVARGEIRISAIALSREPWPEHEKRVSNAFDNQFQLPVLFYIGGFLALQFGASWIEVALAWLFVLSRVIHAWIFAAHNHVIARFWSFAIGFALLVVLWVDLTIRLAAAALNSP